MLQARTTVDGIFSDLGMEADSLDQLKVTLLLSCKAFCVKPGMGGAGRGRG